MYLVGADVALPDMYVVFVLFCVVSLFFFFLLFFFQAEDGIRDLVRSRGLGDVYKRQLHALAEALRGFLWKLLLDVS